VICQLLVCSSVSSSVSSSDYTTALYREQLTVAAVLIAVASAALARAAGLSRTRLALVGLLVCAYIRLFR
jgi:hypothetical protein